VRQFASEDATVVVGTVIDPELSGELRVTVVATGLGRAQTASAARPITTPAAQAVATNRGADASRPARRPVSVPTDYSKLEQPAVERYKAAAGDGLRHDLSEDILDIPAFLRRQAD